jgi:hypothetical protein
LQLKELGSDYRVLHGRSVRSRGAVEDIDHLIIGPNGIFHVETKNWHGSIRFTEDGIERSQPEHHEDPTARLEGSSPLFTTVRLDQLVSSITKHIADSPLSPDDVREVVKLLEEHSKPSVR